MEEVDNRTFILIILSNPHGNWAKALPEESLADIRSNKE
jgi:hypothetical protein